MKSIVAVFALLSLAAFTDANPRVRSFNCVQHRAPVYVAPVYYPTYSVAYNPDLSALAAAMLASVEEQRAMREQLNQLLTSGANGKQFTPEHPGLALMRRDCARCHDSSTKQRGGGRVFFDRGQLVADEKQIEEMILAVDQGRMPKDKKWTGEEKYLHLSYHTLRPVDQPQTQTAGPEPQVLPQPQVDIERLIDQRLERFFEKLSKQQQAPPPKKDDTGDGEQPKKK